MHADPREVSKMQCLHSRASGFLVKNWEETWHIEIDDYDTALDICCNKEVEHCTFQQSTKTATFLAGVQVAGKVL